MKKIFGTILVALFAAVAFAQNDLQPLAVVSYHKKEIITLRNVKTRANFAQKQYGLPSLTVEQKMQIFDNLISEKLLSQAAAKENITISDTQADAAFLSPFSQQFGRQLTESELSEIIQRNTGKSLDDYMKENSGMSLKEFKEHLKSQLMIQQYVASKKMNDIQKVAATDDEIRNAYEMNKTSFIQNDMVKLFLVIVPFGSDKGDSHSQAIDLRKKYSGDAKKLIEIKNSPDNGVKYQAGELMIAKTEQQAMQLGWEYAKIIELFGKKSGFVSEISETENDYQFYSVLAKYDAKMLGLSDIIQPETTVTVYDYIKNNLTNQKQSQYFGMAAQELAKSLDTPSNVDRKKKGADLEKLFNW